jgi:diguanylate cyclase (GGDEF)-like protein
MMDLDGFKLVNDTYGHDVGDDVLRQISRSLQANLRASDFLARYGGDELTLVLSDTDLNQAQVVVEKIKNNLANLPIPLPEGETMFMTVSGGIALHPLHATNAPGLLRAADEALYRAKRSGGSSFAVANTSDA